MKLMFKKNKSDVYIQTTWSEKMLEEFINSCFLHSGSPGVRLVNLMFSTVEGRRP